MALLEAGQLFLVDKARPDLAADFVDQFLGLAAQQQMALVDDGHVGAQVGHVGHDVGRQDHRLVFADIGQQIMEAHALLRVEPGRRLVDDDQFRVAQQGLRDAEALAHATGKAAQALVAHVEQIGLLQQAIDDFAPPRPLRQSFQHGEVVEQFIRRHLRIQAEVLRQVAQHAADLVLVVEYVVVAEEDGAGIALLQGGQGAHQGRLAGAIRAQQAKHPGRYRQRHVIQRHHAIRVGLRQFANLQFHTTPDSCVAARCYRATLCWHCIEFKTHWAVACDTRHFRVPRVQLAGVDGGPLVALSARHESISYGTKPTPG